jgi:phytanoyl-CoA hydroxylase
MITDEQIGQFHRDGVLTLRGVFDREQLRALQRAADEVTAEAVAGRGVGHGYREVDGRRQYYRTDGVLWDRDAAFRMATVNPLLLSAVGQCLGHPFMPINDSLVVKLPRSGVAIRWHQDPPYEGPEGVPDTFGIPNFDCDIYLDEATIENGCLFGLAGYHLAGHVEVERFAEEELYERSDAVRAGPAEPGTEKVELTPDGLVFTGDPSTPPRHWETLIAGMTREQRQAAKTLA